MMRAAEEALYRDGRKDGPWLCELAPQYEKARTRDHAT